MSAISIQSKESLAAFEDALRRRICGVCVDRNVAGECGLSSDQQCELFGHFSKIVRSISRVHSDRIDEYVEAIREDVCAECLNQKLDGSCEVRDSVHCALDRYIVLVVQAIEQARVAAAK